MPYGDEQGEHLLDVEIGIAEGRPACLAIVSAHGQPLTTTLLRQLPLGEFVTERAAERTYRVHKTRRGRYIGVHYPPAFRGMLGFGDELSKLETEVRVTRRIDGDFLQKVAAVYREAVAEGRAPAVALQKEFGPVRRESARRWIAQAREAKKLGPAIRGQAGEGGH